MSGRVGVEVDLRERAPLRRVWRYVGYDEANYTYTAQGRELLDKLGAMDDAPYYIRCHFLLCSGDGKGAAKWGSTNVYTEDDEGQTVYDFELVDRILDAIVESGCIPFIELGFMPDDLSSAPPGTPYPGERGEGWRYPPYDYGRWMALIQALAAHCHDRYGLREVSRWYWELWNEPDIFYWAGTVEDYCRLYDFTVAGLHRVLPQAKVGGPATTSPGNEKAGRFLRRFLEHCTQGLNKVTGSQGTRLDFISFHTKGGGYGHEPDAPKKTPSLATLFRHIDAGLAIVAEFPELQQHEIILSECDPDGWAAGTIADNPNLFYRNTEYYASFVGSAACELATWTHPDGPRVDGMLTWAFQFENRDLFAGSRALSTNGVDKPVLNVFRLLGRLGATQCHLAIKGQEAPDDRKAEAAAPQASGIATVDGFGAIRILLCSHHDDWDVTGEREFEVVVSGAEAEEYALSHWRIDKDHANAYTAWVTMGRPQQPTEDQMAKLKAAGKVYATPVELLKTAADGDGVLRFRVTLPMHGICLLEVRPR